MADIKLRPYQEDAVAHALHHLSERGNSLIVAGTGAGKTIMMAAAIGRFIKGFVAEHKKKPHVLVLVHRTEIHSQNHDKFSMVCPEVATSEITAERKSLHGNVHFGMVQTVHNLLPELTRGNCFFDLIVIDEAHHSAASTYENIIEWNRTEKPESALLGVTATPNRGDELPLIHLFDNFYQITSRFLIESHYLVRPEFLDLSPVFDLEDGKQEKGHLSKNCKDDIEGKELLDKLIDDYLRVKLPGKTVIFAPDHGFCQRIFDRLKELGRNPAYLALGLDDVTRKAEVNRFETDEGCEELINVDIATEGYDYPPLRNLVDFDTNGTHGQWVQKVGRVLRLSEGKHTCCVIDFGGNVELYPDGVETDVLLEGAVKAETGKCLTERDFFKGNDGEKTTATVSHQAEEIYTPYHLPAGFETVPDKDIGIVYVACGDKGDCIIIPNDNSCTLFVGDKQALKNTLISDFDSCVRKGADYIGKTPDTDKPIGKMQIRMLAPEYPTAALSWYGANCCICWKLWKDVILHE